MQCIERKKSNIRWSGRPANCFAAIYNSLSASGLQDE